MVDEGHIRIHVLEAHLTHKTDLIAKMDPYVKLFLREEEWKGPTDKDGGKEPKWTSHNTAEFKVHYLGDDVFFKVFDHEKIGHDQLICEGQVKLAGLLRDHIGFDEWYDLFHKGEHAGKLHLRTEFQKAGGHGWH